MSHRRFIPDTPDQPVIDNAARHGMQIGLDAEPSLFGGSKGNPHADTRTGIPPVFSAADRARWASEREARGFEAFLSRRC